MQRKFVIREYVKRNGRSPFREWLDSLDKLIRARVQGRVWLALRQETSVTSNNLALESLRQDSMWDQGTGFTWHGMGKLSSSFFVEVIRALRLGTLRELKRTGKNIRRVTMPRRSRDWNEGLANDLKDREFAREFVLAALDERLSLQEVLKKVVLATGLKEFSKKAAMPSSNILRVLNPNHNPTVDSVNRLLKPLGLMLTLAPVNKKRAA